MRGLTAVVRNAFLMPRCLWLPVAAQIGIIPLLDAIISLMPCPADQFPPWSPRAKMAKYPGRLRYRSAGSLCLEDHRRPVCRQADLFPRLFRHGHILTARIWNQIQEC